MADCSPTAILQPCYDCYDMSPDAVNTLAASSGYAMRSGLHGDRPSDAIMAHDSLRRGAPLPFFSIECAGLVAATFSSEFSTLVLRHVTSPLLASSLTVQENFAISRLIELPFCFAFPIGLLSDCVPIYGLRRMPYVLIGVALYAIATIVIALAAMSVESQEPDQHSRGVAGLIIVMVAVASFGSLMLHVSVHTHVIALSQREPLTTRGHFQASYLVFRRVASTATYLCTYCLVGTTAKSTTSRSPAALSTALYIAVAITLAPLPLILRCWPRDELHARRDSFINRASMCWRILQQEAVWRTLTFFGFFTLFLSLQFPAPTRTIVEWAGAANDNAFFTQITTEVAVLGGVLLWRYAFLNRPWRSFFSLAPLLLIVPSLITSAIIAFNVFRNRYAYRAIMGLTSVADGIRMVSSLIPLTEIVQERSEGAMVGIALTLQRLLTLSATTTSRTVFRAKTFYDPAAIARDESFARNAVFNTLVGNYTINGLSMFGLLLLPRQKLDAQHMRMFGEFSRVASWMLVIVSVLLLVYAVVFNVIAIPSTASLAMQSAELVLDGILY